MGSTLQQRAQEFLKRPIPKDMGYVPNSIAEMLLNQYAADGHLTLDADMAELFYMVVTEYDASAAEQWNPGEREYLTESQTILELILKEEMARPTWPAPFLLP